MANPGLTDLLVSSPSKDVRAEPRELYPVRSQAVVRSQLVEALQRRDGVVVLTGDSGTGKTTLCRSVVRSLEPPTSVAEIVNSAVTIDDLLKQTLADFGATVEQPIAGQSSHELVLALGRFLDSMPAGGRALLIVDEAHDVRAEVLAQLRTLANLRTRDGRGLLILLVGQPTLEAMLARVELLSIRQRVSRHCHLEPLEADEIPPYIAYRFGGPRRPAFQPAAVRTVAAASRGVPRTINLLVDRALEIAVERKASTIGREVIVESAGRSGVRVPIAQHPAARRMALVAVLAVVSTLSAWLMATRLVPAVRSLVASKPAEQAPPSARTSPAPSTASNPAPSASTVTPSAPAAAPVSPSPEPATTGTLESVEGFLVLAGSFRNARNAEASADRLSKLPLPAFTRPEGDWNVVLVGPYLTPEEAREARERIGRDFPDAHVIRSRLTDEQK